MFKSASNGPDRGTTQQQQQQGKIWRDLVTLLLFFSFLLFDSLIVPSSWNRRGCASSIQSQRPMSLIFPVPSGGESRWRVEEERSYYSILFLFLFFFFFRPSCPLPPKLNRHVSLSTIHRVFQFKRSSLFAIARPENRDGPNQPNHYHSFDFSTCKSEEPIKKIHNINTHFGFLLSHPLK